MENAADMTLHLPGVYDIRLPDEQRVPVVVASPHSGRDYRPEFLDSCALDSREIRKSEDAYIDDIFGGAPGIGAPLIRALFPRAFLDVNREAHELDPAMFDGPLPGGTNVASPRVAAGLGVIPRLVAAGYDIYKGKLPVAEAERRLAAYYRPWHKALARLVTETRLRFGCCILLDCHSMPAASIAHLPERPAADIILGDCFGLAADAGLIARMEARLSSMNYKVVRNKPYAGGHITRTHGRPAEGVHAVQIEINRSLYMDEFRYEKRPFFGRLAADMTRLVAGLAAASPLAEAAE
jgi:N-formylglutamate amidohydrolase